MESSACGHRRRPAPDAGLRNPNNARPTRTIVEPARTATSMSSDIPIDSSASPRSTSEGRHELETGLCRLGWTKGSDCHQTPGHKPGFACERDQSGRLGRGAPVSPRQRRWYRPGRTSRRPGACSAIETTSTSLDTVCQHPTTGARALILRALDRAEHVPDRLRADAAPAPWQRARRDSSPRCRKDRSRKRLRVRMRRIPSLRRPRVPLSDRLLRLRSVHGCSRDARLRLLAVGPRGAIHRRAGHSALRQFASRDRQT